MVHMCKRIISPEIFFTFFPNFNFWGQSLLQKRKNGPKCQKIIAVSLHISGSIHHMILIFCTHVILIFWVVWGCKRAKIDPKWQQIMFALFRISEAVPYIIVVFGAHLYNDDSSSNFFHFYKILIFWVFRA